MVQKTKRQEVIDMMKRKVIKQMEAVKILSQVKDEGSFIMVEQSITQQS